ncbi:DNA-deoxyinosine glycosylase [Pseudoduganella sp. GCM10020061]|uniref:DNA-deoxyinosine glycosylase n=1 Tax=Pseudoduganella sp. GCM10020061 TaxID=3317345 RepID=UPI00363A78F8
MDEAGTAGRKRGFPPVVDAHTRILVLGSLPGELSLANAQYYGNPRNAFWRLMSELTGYDLVALDYPQRLDALLACGIGLWDVVAEAERSGSLDTNIRDRADNDLCALLADYPGIEVIAFNGGTAERIGARVLGQLRSRYQVAGLPSSSPAHTLPFADKLQRWSVLRPAIAAAMFQRAGVGTT